MKTPYTLLFILLVAISSCKKDESNDVIIPTESNPSLNLGIRFRVDGPSLAFDTIAYENQAHNHYSVTTLVFYLSRISLVKADSSVIQIKDWIYVDARTASTLDVSFKDIPEGCYTGIKFNFGIDSAHNVQDGLPATSENLMMEWPQMMGGGYHFLKLEGYFTDSTGTPGYAMHLGTNNCLIKFQFQDSICVDKADISRTLVMNINEWYRNPAVFDLNADGNYIMGDSAAMKKFAINGSDVFTLEQ